MYKEVLQLNKSLPRYRMLVTLLFASPGHAKVTKYRTWRNRRKSK